MSLKKADEFIKKAKLEIYKHYKDTEISAKSIKYLNLASSDLPFFEDNHEDYVWKVRQLRQNFSQEGSQ